MDASYLFVRNFMNTEYEKLSRKAVEETKKQVLDFVAVAVGGYSQAGAAGEAAIEWAEPPKHHYRLRTRFRHRWRQANSSMAHSWILTMCMKRRLCTWCNNNSTSLAAELIAAFPARFGFSAVGGIVSRMGLATRPGQNIHKYGWHFTTLNGFMVSAAVGLAAGRRESMLSAGIGYHQASEADRQSRTVLLRKDWARFGSGRIMAALFKRALPERKTVWRAFQAIIALPYGRVFKRYSLGSWRAL